MALGHLSAPSFVNICKKSLLKNQQSNYIFTSRSDSTQTYVWNQWDSNAVSFGLDDVLYGPLPEG